MKLPFCKWPNIINFIWFNLIAKGRKIISKSEKIHFLLVNTLKDPHKNEGTLQYQNQARVLHIG